MKINKKSVTLEAYYLQDGFIHLILNDGKERHYKVNVGNGHEEEAIDYIDSLPQTASSINEIKNKWDLTPIALTEDTVKTSNGEWTNKGKEGTHGKFKTKKQADAQRKAMFANGYKAESRETDKLYNESLGDDLDKLKQDIDNMQIGDSVTVKNYKNGDIYKFEKLGNNGTIGDFVNVLGKNHMASKQHVLGWAKDSLIYAKYSPKFEFKESFKEDTLKEGEEESDKKSKEHSFDDFLNTTFDIYYGGKKVGTCKGSDFRADSEDDFDEIIEESLNESSKLDIIKSNRKAYQDVENYIKKVKDPLEKDVYQHLILKWLSNNNWLGGMSDSAFQKQYEKYLSNYSEDEVLDKYDELIGKFDSNNNFKESLTEDLSPEEVGTSSVFNDLIQKEYDLLSQYDSVQITLEDNGDHRFSDIFEYIKDDINIHIGMLQSCLEDLNGSEEQNAEGEQKADQLLNLDESLFD